MIKFFNSVINLFFATNNQKKILRELKAGDMVWAQMPLRMDELEKISPTHRVRPYLVMWKDFANIYAYQSSSKRCKDYNNYETYMINKFRYENRKDSWIDLSNIVRVPVNCLKEKLCMISEPDFIMIEKRLKIQKNRNKNIKKFFDVDFNIREGDIISDNSKKYYVFDSNESKLFCYVLTKRLKGNEKNYKKVKINGKYNYIYFDKEIVINKNSEIKIIDMAYLEEVIIINQLKRNIKIRLSAIDKDKYKVGSIFKVKSREIMYLYESNGVCYGVDVFLYKALPRVVSIYNPDSREIIDIYDKDKVIDIVTYLNNNLQPPSKKIRKLYDKLVMKLVQ